MKKYIIHILLIVVFTAGMKVLVQAQPGDPDPDAVPLDPGSWVLVAAGVGYGVNKWRATKQENRKKASDTIEYSSGRENGDNC